jgi:hypothetical protein
MDLARDDFTRHRLHLRNSDKDELLAALTGKIKVENPISLTWKKTTSIKSNGIQCS